MEELDGTSWIPTKGLQAVVSKVIVPQICPHPNSQIQEYVS